MHDEDDLTTEDLKFLDRWKNLGRADTDAEYFGNLPSMDGVPVAEADVEEEILDAFENGEFDGGSNGDRRTDISDEETDQVESEDGDTLDLSEPQGGTELSDEAENRDQLQEGDTDSDIPDGESDLEYDGLSDQSEAEDDELDMSDDDDDFEHHGEPELGGDDAQIEEDDGPGERANSDEARESDEPISQNEELIDKQDAMDQESERDDPELAEDDQHEQQVEDEHDRAQTPQADATEDFEGDAQQELEDHLRNEQEKPEPQDEADEVPDNERSKSHNYSDLPGAPEQCENHCEDNEQDDDDQEECPHCSERIQREREQWGPIAKDMRGNDLLPGDKVRVQVPVSFMIRGAILTANVPNTELDRYAVKTDGTEDHEACWLSGHAISQFTGWHLFEHGPIWTFQLGRKIGFVEKIGEPKRGLGGDHDLNSEDTDQPDLEEMIEDLKQDLDNFGKDKDEPESEEEEITEENIRDKMDEVDPEFLEEEKTDEDDPDFIEDFEDRHEENLRKLTEVEESKLAELRRLIDEARNELSEIENKKRQLKKKHQEQKEEEGESEPRLTSAQMERFENLAGRIFTKAVSTFGTTSESMERGQNEDGLLVGEEVAQTLEIVSRGVIYRLHFTAERED